MDRPLDRREDGYWSQVLDESEYAPKVAGVPAIPDYQPPEMAEFWVDQAAGTSEMRDIITLGGVLSYFRCPFCKARLAASHICLNACHLGGRGAERFHAHLRAALARTTGPD